MTENRDNIGSSWLSGIADMQRKVSKYYPQEIENTKDRLKRLLLEILRYLQTGFHITQVIQ